MIGRRRLRLAAVLLLASCSLGPRKAYERAMWDQTERLRVAWRTGTALDLRATYLSDGFRAALLDEQGRLLGPVANLPAARTRSQQDAEAYHEVVFSAASGLYDDRIEFGVDRGWKLKLTDESGAEQPLVTVFRLRKASALDRELFPHDTLWSELWVARFVRKTPSPRRLSLHVGSGYGHATAHFDGDQLR